SVRFGQQVFGTADFAVAFWLRTTAAGPQAVLGDRVTAGDGNFFSVCMDDAGHLVAELEQDAAGTNDVALTSTGVVNDGAFHHVALVRSGTTLSLYLDGALDSSAASAGVTNLTSTRPLVAGAEPAADLVPAFTGLLDEIQVYRRALTGQEVQA